VTALIDSLAEEIGPLNKNILKPTIHLNGTSAEELSNRLYRDK